MDGGLKQGKISFFQKKKYPDACGRGSLTCSAGVFFGRANVFARESVMSKLQKREGNKGREGGSAENISPLPPPFSSFRPNTYPKGLLSPVLLCHKIKDDGYNHTNINKLSATQSTPALTPAL